MGMGSSLNEGRTKIVRHPHRKDPKRDPNLENYHYSTHERLEGGVFPFPRFRVVLDVGSLGSWFEFLGFTVFRVHDFWVLSRLQESGLAAESRIIILY